MEALVRSERVQRLVKTENVSRYNAMLERLGRHRRGFHVTDVFDEMRLNGVPPSWESFGEAFNCYLVHRMLPQAQQCFKKMESQGFHPTSNTYAVLIGVTAHTGQLEYALQLIEEMQEKAIPITERVQNHLLSCYANTHASSSALALLDELIMKRVKLDVQIFTETIRAIQLDASEESLEHKQEAGAAQIEDILGKAADYLDLETDLSARDYLLRAAQDAYSRLRMYGPARDAFEHMNHPDGVSYRCHFFTYAEEACKKLDDNPSADELPAIKTGLVEAFKLTREMDRKGFPLRIFHACLFIRQAYKLAKLAKQQELTAGPDECTFRAWSLELVGMSLTVAMQLDRGGLAFTEYFGASVISDALEEGSDSSLNLAEVVFDNMYRLVNPLAKPVCKLYLEALQARRPEDHVRIARAAKLLESNTQLRKEIPSKRTKMSLL